MRRERRGVALLAALMLALGGSASARLASGPFLVHRGSAARRAIESAGFRVAEEGGRVEL